MVTVFYREFRFLVFDVHWFRLEKPRETKSDICDFHVEESEKLCIRCGVKGVNLFQDLGRGAVRTTALSFANFIKSLHQSVFKCRFFAHIIQPTSNSFEIPAYVPDRFRAAAL